MLPCLPDLNQSGHNSLPQWVSLDGRNVERWARWKGMEICKNCNLQLFMLNNYSVSSFLNHCPRPWWRSKIIRECYVEPFFTTMADKDLAGINHQLARQSNKSTIYLPPSGKTKAGTHLKDDPWAFIDVSKSETQPLRIVWLSGWCYRSPMASWTIQGKVLELL